MGNPHIMAQANNTKKVVLVGDGLTGKTSIYWRFHRNTSELPDFSPTMVENSFTNDDTNIDLADNSDDNNEDLENKSIDHDGDKSNEARKETKNQKKKRKKKEKKQKQKMRKMRKRVY